MHCSPAEVLLDAMGCGTSSKQDDVSCKVSAEQASGNSNKTVPLVSSDYPAFTRQEDEVKWLRLKLEQEKNEKEWLLSRTVHQASSSSSSATTSGISSANLQEDLCWLRKAFDAEKTEKAWLMTRFEVAEAQLQTRREECVELRAQLVAYQIGHKAAPQPLHRSVKDGGLIPEPGLPGVVMEPYSPTDALATSPALSSRADLGSPCSTESPKHPSLKDRRGMRSLSVDTLGGDKRKEAASPRPQAASPRPTPAAAPAPLVLQPSADASPRSKAKSTFSHNNPTEPASPLLRKRLSYKEKAIPSSMLPVTMEAQEALPVQPLKIDAFKVSTLDDDFPASPKRKRKSAVFNEATGAS